MNGQTTELGTVGEGETDAFTTEKIPSGLVKRLGQGLLQFCLKLQIRNEQCLCKRLQAAEGVFP